MKREIIKVNYIYIYINGIQPNNQFLMIKSKKKKFCEKTIFFTYKLPFALRSRTFKALFYYPKIVVKISQTDILKIRERVFHLNEDHIYE